MSPTTTELERYFGANAANEWDLLLGHLEFSSGFAFIVLLVPDNTAGEVCERDLERVLKAQGKHLERAPTESPRELQNLPQWLLDRDGHSDVSAIWVKEITTQPFSGAPPAEKVIFASWEHAWKEAISRLNERRDTLKSRYACPIIFVGAPWLKVLLREYAPDLWSVRKLVIELQPEATRRDSINEGLTVSEDIISGLITDEANDSLDVITDPDFAMKRLHEATNQEQILSLLNRAYMGFRSQGRYSEALKAIDQALKLNLTRNDRAQLLNRLGVVLSDLGRREDALKATLESVNIRRNLARDNPQAFKPDLAGSLNNLGVRLNDVGQREAALLAAQESVNIRRILAQDNPQAFQQELALSLNNLGVNFNSLGRVEEALKVTQEATELFRDLARDNPQAFKRDLVMSLNNLGGNFNSLGKVEDALTVTQEAADLALDLAQGNPQAFLPDLAMSLNNLGSVLISHGRLEESLAITQKATEVYRDLAQDNPKTFKPDLALSLNNLGGNFNRLGRVEDAVAVTQEAINLRRDLARDNPPAFEPDLAGSLNNLGDWYWAINQAQQAHPQYEEAIRILAPYFLDLPIAHAHRMEYMVQDYFQSCKALNLEPDMELLEPVMKKLEELNAQNES